MTQAEKTAILKALKKHARVEYTGIAKEGNSGRHPIKNGDIGFKMDNGRKGKASCMRVKIGKNVNAYSWWYIDFEDLTCATIEVIERLEQASKTHI